MKKLNMDSCYMVQDYLKDLGYSDQTTEEVISSLQNMLEAINGRHSVGIFNYLDNRKRVRQLKNVIVNEMNTSIQGLYSQYSIDLVKAGQNPLTLEQILEESKEKEQKEEDSEKSID